MFITILGIVPAPFKGKLPLVKNEPHSRQEKNLSLRGDNSSSSYCKIRRKRRHLNICKLKAQGLPRQATIESRQR